MLALWRANNQFMEFKWIHIPSVYKRHRTFSAEFCQNKSALRITQPLFMFLPATGPCVTGNNAWIQRSCFGSTDCGQSESARTVRKLDETRSAGSCQCLQNKSSAFFAALPRLNGKCSCIEGMTKTNIFVMHITIIRLHAKNWKIITSMNTHLKQISTACRALACVKYVITIAINNLEISTDHWSVNLELDYCNY